MVPELPSLPPLAAPEAVARRAAAAAAFLKAMSHEGRLTILCHLSGAERSVTELETLLACRQAAVSQQLARLRAEGLVTCRREGKAIFYALADDRVRRLLSALHDTVCREGTA